MMVKRLKMHAWETLGFGFRPSVRLLSFQLNSFMYEKH